MILRLLFLISWLVAGVSLSHAAMQLDVLEVGPITYSNVTILGANATDLFFKHDRGISNVKLKYVNDNLKKEFGYDPMQAEIAEARQAREQAMFQAFVKTNVVKRPPAMDRVTAEAAAKAEHLMDPISDKSILGKTAPAFKAEKWLGDQPDVAGKFVLIQFWSPSSVPSVKSIPDLNGYQKKLGDKLVVIGIACASEKQVADLEGVKIDFACALDPQLKYAAATGVTSVPSTLLLDPNRTVIYEGHPAALNEATLKAIINRPVE
jgi:cytochrome c biogenesis protein CcmG/thiol:disulfide interchange protein DsbE